MPSLPPWSIAVWFLFLAVVFATLAALDRRRTAGKPSPRRRTWTRLAVIFGIVAVALAYLHGWP